MSSDFLNDAQLQTVLQSLETDRRKIVTTRLQAIAMILIGAALFAAGVFTGFNLMPLWGYGVLAATIIIPGLLMFSKSSQQYKVYADCFKKEVIGAALSSIDQSLMIKPEYGIGEQEFINSQLFDKQPDRYSSEDFVSGSAGKTSFYFAEVHAEYKTVSTDSKGRRTETWHDILKGIVFSADFNKNFSGLTLVRPKDFGGTVSKWISKAMPFLSSGAEHIVELENLEFNNTFITQATDQIEARYILTPAMMDKLCELNDRCLYTPSLSFIGSSVYIAFPLIENYFEPPLFKSILRPSFMERDISLIRFMYGIIRDLDLNTRIWGKN